MFLKIIFLINCSLKSSLLTRKTVSRCALLPSTGKIKDFTVENCVLLIHPFKPKSCWKSARFGRETIQNNSVSVEVYPNAHNSVAQRWIRIALTFLALVLRHYKLISFSDELTWGRVMRTHFDWIPLFCGAGGRCSPGEGGVQKFGLHPQLHNNLQGSRQPTIVNWIDPLLAIAN